MIGFIGAGKVGFTLGKYLSTQHVEVAGYYSEHIDDAREAAEFTDTQYFSDIESLITCCDTLFLTVPDSVIPLVWNQVKQYPIDGKNICHCSGSLTSDIFIDIQKFGAYGYSVHPIYAIHDKYQSFKTFSEIYFTVEGCEERIKPLATLIENMGNQVRIISAENKALYHTASVMVSNMVVALASIGSDLFSQCGFDAEFAENAWHALFLGNAQNICTSGVINALTGPIERGDISTVSKHINVLNEPERRIYLSLSQVLLNIARQKNPQRDYSLLQAAINANGVIQ